MHAHVPDFWREGGLPKPLAFDIPVNFAIPFVVANLGLMNR